MRECAFKFYASMHKQYFGFEGNFGLLVIYRGHGMNKKNSRVEHSASSVTRAGFGETINSKNLLTKSRK